MKFKLKRNLFYIIIFLIVCVGIISSLILRASIIKYDYDTFVSEENQYLYYPYEDLKHSGGVFTDITTEDNIDMNNFSDYIVEGIATGKHEILKGAVLTQIKITKVIKGDIEKENIYIYEPISIEIGKSSSKYLGSMLGYNFIKDNEEYVFCINKFSNIEDHVYTEKEKKSYVYENPFLAKFPMKYNDSDFKIGEEYEFDTNNKYNEYANCEQMFSSEKNKKLYFKCREQLMQIIN
ncbi:MAG: hypothetical protein K0R54_4704 [Clostridiaceae bacterium]|jgi:hypothetical protein|nr:hypothetical protein [Clostridiaceae bacterium]